MENVCSHIIKLSESDSVVDWERCAGLQLIMGLIFNPSNNIVKGGLMRAVFNKKMTIWIKSLCNEEEMDDQKKLIIKLIRESVDQELGDLAPINTELGIIQHLLNATRAKILLDGFLLPGIVDIKEQYLADCIQFLLRTYSFAQLVLICRYDNTLSNKYKEAAITETE